MEFLEISTINDLRSFLHLKWEDFLLYTKGRDSSLFYDTFYLLKKTGKKGLKANREISCPIGKLKNSQHILKLEFEKIYKPNKHAHGFIQGCSIVTNAQCHVNRNIIINIDLKDYFPSIHIGRIIGLLMSKPFNFNKIIATAIAQICTKDGKLPQGSPCSPIIANMISHDLDRDIAKYINRRQIRYTRYADDITISMNKLAHLSLFFTEDKKINENFNKIFIKNNFRINEEKTRIQNRNMHQEVTGIKVNKRTNIKKFLKYSTRAMLHAASKFGIEKAALRWAEINKRNVSNHLEAIKKFDNCLRGKISYIGMVCGTSNNPYINLSIEYNKLNHGEKIKLKTNDEDIIQNRSVFLICLENGSTGTGFLYKDYLVTCYHCVELQFKNKSPVFVCNLADGKNKSAINVLCTDEKHDIAICSAPKKYGNVYIKESNTNEIKNEESLITIGYPGYCEEIAHSPVKIRGQFAGDRIIKNITYFVSKDATYEPGISGSPVLNSKCELVGMATHATPDAKKSKLDNANAYVFFIDKLISKYENK